MRESEFHGWNGTIWYLLGTLIAVQLFPKDIGIVAVLLLSWCDTAASTGGRLWGQYTPKIRQGKTWAGSIAAAITGGITAAFFWGFFAPRFGAVFDFEENVFAYQGSLSLPAALARNLGFTGVPTIRGNLALGVISIWAGFVASASEVVDLFGWDDNLTIPALCSVGLWGFLKAFGGQAL